MHADDPNLKCIRILNNLMENFLDENLYKWFDNQYALEMITNNTVQ